MSQEGENVQAEPGPEQQADHAQPTASPSQLVRDEPTWLYQGFHGTLATRRLQVWQTAPGRLVAVVTEQHDDGGTSITNAAEAVIAQLAAEHPDHHVEVIEHYTARPPTHDAHAYERWTLTSGDGEVIEFPPAAETIPADSWDLVSLDTSGYATWQPLTPTDVARILGLTTDEAGAMGLR